MSLQVVRWAVAQGLIKEGEPFESSIRTWLLKRLEEMESSDEDKKKDDDSSKDDKKKDDDSPKDDDKKRDHDTEEKDTDPGASSSEARNKKPRVG